MVEQQADQSTGQQADQATDQHTAQASLRVLVVGGAGHVGGIIRPALEAVHTVKHLDLNPVPGAEQSTYIGSVTDRTAVREAVKDIDAVIYLAMGIDYGESEETEVLGDGPDVVQRNFDVNVQGVYRVLLQAMDIGVRRFVYASTLSVYGRYSRPDRVDESIEPNAWRSYGLTKRLGERICEVGGMNHPEATIIGLRLVHPLSEEQYVQRQAHLAAGGTGRPDRPNRPDRAQRPNGRGRGRRRGFNLWSNAALAPGDLRRLFLAAVAVDKPGVHLVQTSGDKEGKFCPNDAATALLGWAPRGE